MTIKKNGGVFGRNPKFRNVAVDTLTVGGALATFPATSFTAARADAAQSFTGDQTLATGNLVIGTAGKGIDFSADSSATGMTSEVFDDYEEGTWTPVVQTTNNNAVISTTVNKAIYSKIGNVVNIQCYLTVNVTSVGTGGLQITGVPFTPQSNSFTAVTNAHDDLSGSSGQGYLYNGAIIFTNANSTAGLPIAGTGVRYVMLSATYFV